MKAVLVIDIGEEAYEEISKSEVYQMCVDIGYDYTEYGYSFHRPKKVLALKPLPKKKPQFSSSGDMYQDRNNPNIIYIEKYFGYNEGYNACLDEILGETE